MLPLGWYPCQDVATESPALSKLPEAFVETCLRFEAMKEALLASNSGLEGKAWDAIRLDH